MKELKTTESPGKEPTEEEKKGMEPLQQIASKWASFMLSFVIIYAFVLTGEDT